MDPEQGVCQRGRVRIKSFVPPAFCFYWESFPASYISQNSLSHVDLLLPRLVFTLFLRETSTAPKMPSKDQVAPLRDARQIVTEALLALGQDDGGRTRYEVLLHWTLSLLLHFSLAEDLC